MDTINYEYEIGQKRLRQILSLPIIVLLSSNSQPNLKDERMKCKYLVVIKPGEGGFNSHILHFAFHIQNSLFSRLHFLCFISLAPFSADWFHFRYLADKNKLRWRPGNPNHLFHSRLHYAVLFAEVRHKEF